MFDWLNSTATAAAKIRGLESPDCSSNVNENEEWSYKYYEQQKRSDRKEDCTEDHPRSFAFRNPSNRLEYRDSTEETSDTGYQKDEPQKNLDDPDVEIDYQLGKHSAPSPR